MSSDDTFIARWSRLKRSAAQSDKARAATPAPGVPQGGDAAAGRTGGAPAAEPQPAEELPFDPASLPPIESIVADSDIRAFLRSEVPSHLTRAALRRAWSADPAIRDFIGLAENQWDFTDPASIPGFGSIEATEDLRQLVSQAMGGLQQGEEDVATSQDPQARSEDRNVGAAGAAPAKAPQPHPDVDTGGPEVADGSAAMQEHGPAEGERPAAPARKGHGRAVPR